MKLMTITQLTLDGVTGNGGPTVEDREGGFERGGWARGAGDDTTRDHIAATFQRADAFLFGRRTYDILLDFWGTVGVSETAPDRGGLELEAEVRGIQNADRDPEWANTAVLGDELFAAVTELKATGTANCRYTEAVGSLSGSSEKGLVDEMELIIVPVVLGRLPPLQLGRDIAMNLVDSRSDSKGVMVARLIGPLASPTTQLSDRQISAVCRSIRGIPWICARGTGRLGPRRESHPHPLRQVVEARGYVKA